MIEDFKVEFANKIFECVDKGFDKNQKVDVVIRPEDIEIIKQSDDKLTGCVEDVIFKGIYYEMRVRQNDYLWKIQSTVMSPVGATVSLEIKPDLIHVMRK